MSRSTLRTILIVAAIVGVIGLLVWAGRLSTPMLPRAAREWSRGRLVGETSVNRPVALRPAPGGGAVLVWPNMDNDLQFVRVAADGQIAVDRTLTVHEDTPREPQLVTGADDQLYLLWREEQQPGMAIRIVRIDADGAPLGQPVTLHRAAQWMIDAPDLVADDAGRLHAVWADEQGIHYTTLAPDSSLLDEPALVAPGGRYPTLRVDGAGALHLAWQQPLSGNEYALYTARLDPHAGRWSEPLPLATVFTRIGQRLDGPEVGLDDEAVYVFWTIEDRRDVSSRTEVARLPLDAPTAFQVTPLALRRGWNPTGVSASDARTAPLEIVLSETTIEGGQGILLQALFRASARDQAVAQIALLRIPGGPEGETIITAARQALVKPVLVVDGRSQRHIAAIQIAGGNVYRVVYATDAPEVGAVYNRITPFDVVDAVLSLLLQGSLFVLSVIPLLLLWASLPTLILIVYHWFSGDEELDLPRSRIALGVVIALEVALMLLLPPRIDLTWAPLQWVAPLVTAVLSGAITWLVLRRREENLLFLSFILFTLVNTLLVWLAYFLF